MGVLITPTPAPAQEANPAPPARDELRALREKIDELERQVKALEARQAPDSGTNAENKKVEELDQKVRILERNHELEQQAAEAKEKELPRFSIGENGFTLRSADTNFAVQLGGVLQVDSRSFFDDSGIVGNDSLLLRRARPMLSGTVFRDFDFLFVPDFAPSSGPTIFDAYLNYRYTPALQLEAGKFKTPVGLEQLQADRNLFFNERALPTDLVPNRDVGFMLHGDLFGQTLSYAVGIFNGVGDGQNLSNVSVQDNKEFAGRVFVPAVRFHVQRRPAGSGLRPERQLSSAARQRHHRLALQERLRHRGTAGVLRLQPDQHQPGRRRERGSLAALTPGDVFLRAVPSAG